MNPNVPALVAGLVIALSVSIASNAHAQQQTPFDRLPPAVFDVMPPSDRVAGEPGSMSIRRTACPTPGAAHVRRRIVELAVQEWAYFGFTIVDQTEVSDEDAFGPRRSRRRPGDAQSVRVADSIAGYWSVTPGGDWILDSQNKIWNGPDGATSRWRFPWSAAFVSWVMCESGLGSPEQFQRAIAHHTYIDQAIRARDQKTSPGAFVAYEPGEADIAPGDLLCTARRPAYSALGERRRQMGQGARTHCDIVVRVDRQMKHVLAIGGNVRGSVSLKIIPLVDGGGTLRPPDRNQIRGGRAIFAHLKLRAAPFEADAFAGSPTMKALGCAGPPAGAARRLVSGAITGIDLACRASNVP